MQQALYIRRLTLGEQATNCYVVWSHQTKHGYVIDPADSGDIISELLIKENIDLQGILLTHGHFDHLLALLELSLNFPVPVFLHPSDQFLLERAQVTAEHFLGRAADPVPTQFSPLADQHTLPLADTARIIAHHTPGHTPGSCSFQIKSETAPIYFEQEDISNISILMTGDMLFSYGIEPLTHAYSRPLQLYDSLEKLQRLGDQMILPGHGEPAWLSDAVGQIKKKSV